jgi:hypothetical protein
MQYKIISLNIDNLLSNIDRLLKLYKIVCIGTPGDEGIYSYVLQNQKGEDVSESLFFIVLSNGTINVDEFFPNLNHPKNPNSKNKGLSSALFYLLLAHIANNGNLASGTKVTLMAKMKVLTFYKSMQEFEFNVTESGRKKSEPSLLTGGLFNFDPQEIYTNQILPAPSSVQ